MSEERTAIADPRDVEAAKVVAWFLRACADEDVKVQPFMLRRTASILEVLAATHPPETEL